MSKISVGQALLILMENYKKDSEKLSVLKKLYLSGIENDSDKILLEYFLKNPLLSQYKVSQEYEVISADPVRRYFETQLAYHTLIEETKKLNNSDLYQHFNWLYSTLPEKEKEEFNSIFKDDENEDVLEKKEYFDMESADAIHRIYKDKNFKEFSDEDKYKLALLIKISYLGFMHIKKFDEKIPLKELYKEGYFKPENKGRITKKNHLIVPSISMGIMRNFMPIPHGDIVSTAQPFRFTRSPDRSEFDSKSTWVEDNFKRAVHPYVNSPSGTFLSQLRILNLMHNCKVLCFNDKEKMENFIKSFVSALLLLLGGHSYHEFFHPLSIQKIQKKFKFIPGFNEFTINKLLLDNNPTAFSQALSATLVYNKIILKRQAVRTELVKQYLESKDEKATKKITPIERKFEPQHSFFGDIQADKPKSYFPHQTEEEIERKKIASEIKIEIKNLKTLNTKLSMQQADVLFRILQIFLKLDLKNYSKIVNFSKEILLPEIKYNSDINKFESTGEKILSILKQWNSKENETQTPTRLLLEKINKFIKKLHKTQSSYSDLASRLATDSKLSEKKSSTKKEADTIMVDKTLLTETPATLPHKSITPPLSPTPPFPEMPQELELPKSTTPFSFGSR